MSRGCGAPRSAPRDGTSAPRRRAGLQDRVARASQPRGERVWHRRWGPCRARIVAPFTRHRGGRWVADVVACAFRGGFRCLPNRLLMPPTLRGLQVPSSGSSKRQREASTRASARRHTQPLLQPAPANPVTDSSLASPIIPDVPRRYSGRVKSRLRTSAKRGFD